MYIRVKTQQEALLRLSKLDVDLPIEIADFPKKTIQKLSERGVIPTFINQTLDDSVCIETDIDDHYLLTEFYSDGDIVILKRPLDRDKRKFIDAWDLTKANYFDVLDLILWPTDEQE